MKEHDLGFNPIEVNRHDEKIMKGLENAPVYKNKAR